MSLGDKTFNDILKGGIEEVVEWHDRDDVLLTGYGAEAIEITEEDIKKLRQGKVACFDVQGEYLYCIGLKK